MDKKRRFDIAYLILTVITVLMAQELWSGN